MGAEGCGQHTGCPVAVSVLAVVWAVMAFTSVLSSLLVLLFPLWTILLLSPPLFLPVTASNLSGLLSLAQTAKHTALSRLPRAQHRINLVCGLVLC